VLERNDIFDWAAIKNRDVFAETGPSSEVLVGAKCGDEEVVFSYAS
jgi:hypothetical protein